MISATNAGVPIGRVLYYPAVIQVRGLQDGSSCSSSWIRRICDTDSQMCNHFISAPGSGEGLSAAEAALNDGLMAVRPEAAARKLGELASPGSLSLFISSFNTPH